MSRTLRPLATDGAAVYPVTVTDRNCGLVLGLEARPFRELVAKLRIPHLLAGRRLVVAVEDFLAAVRRAPPVEPVEIDEPDVDTLLARLGRQRASGAR